MNGSEKQNRWAEEILNNVRQNANETIAAINAQYDKKLEKAKEKNYPAERIEKNETIRTKWLSEVNELFDYIDKIENAGRTIDLRGSLERSNQKLSAPWRHIAADIASLAGILL
jgi:hypothetical protein